MEREMRLFIPGPVTTDPAVREAASRDYAPWDDSFRERVARLRQRLLSLAGGRPGEHAALILQGCGHFGLEAACRTLVPERGRLLIPKTGQYADRLARLARECGREVIALPIDMDRKLDPSVLESALAEDAAVTHVALVYSETSTGIVHDVPALAAVAERAGRRVIVDAVSAFGALPFDIGALAAVDSVTFTSNKCLEGLPGLSFTVARIDRLEASIGRAGSWSFDLADLYQHDRTAPGVFRFTPPAGVLIGLDVALDLLEREGGPPARLKRYDRNMRTLYDGVQRIGLRPCLAPSAQGPIVVNVEAPDDPSWSLARFVDGLKEEGVLISNFYNTEQPSFRVGCIGAISPEDMGHAVSAMQRVMDRMGITRRQAA